MFAEPVVLLRSAAAPVAVFSSAVFRRSVPAPMAVLKLASAVLLSETKPTAVLYVPVVRWRRAFCPPARVASRIASYRRRDKCLRCWQNRKAGEHDGNEKESKPGRRPAD